LYFFLIFYRNIHLNSLYSPVHPHYPHVIHRSSTKESKTQPSLLKNRAGMSTTTLGLLTSYPQTLKKQVESFKKEGHSRL